PGFTSRVTSSPCWCASSGGKRSCNARFTRSGGTPYDAATGSRFYAVRATRSATVPLPGDRSRAGIPRAARERRSVVRLGVSLALNTSKQDPLRGASSAPDPGRTDLVGAGVRVTSVPASVLHAKAGGPESLLEWQLHFGQLRRLKADEA